MDLRRDVGQISQITLHGNCYKWVINDIFSLPQGSTTRLISPEFTFEDKTCSLGFWPCVEDILGLDWIGLSLWIHPNNYPMTQGLGINVKIGLLNRSGEECKSCSVQYEDNYSDSELFTYEVPCFLSKAEFMQDMNVIAPNGTVVAFCEICKKNESEVVVSSEEYSFNGPKFWPA